MRYGRRTSRPHSLHTYLQILPFDFPGDPDSDGLGEVRTKAAPSSIDWAGLSFMAFPDVVPDRIRAQLLPGGRSASSLVPPKTEYPDTQSVYPWPATEGDVVDCVVSNCLDAMVGPLNDILMHAFAQRKKQKKYYPDGSQVDHMYVVHPAKPRYVRQGNYVDTTEFTGEPRQFVVLIVEEKVLGYVSKFANKVEWKKEVLVTDLSSLPPNGLQRATYAQLLKYSSTFKCTRLLLTDYATTYGMQLSAPAPAATSMLPGDADGIDEASDELEEHGEEWHEDGEEWGEEEEEIANDEHGVLEDEEERVEEEEDEPEQRQPNFLCYHWLSGNIRSDVFFLCLAGFQELGLLEVSEPIQSEQARLRSVADQLDPTTCGTLDELVDRALHVHRLTPMQIPLPEDRIKELEARSDGLRYVMSRIQDGDSSAKQPRRRTRRTRPAPPPDVHSATPTINVIEPENRRNTRRTIEHRQGQSTGVGLGGNIRSLQQDDRVPMLSTVRGMPMMGSYQATPAPRQSTPSMESPQYGPLPTAYHGYAHTGASQGPSSTPYPPGGSNPHGHDRGMGRGSQQQAGPSHPSQYGQQTRGPNTPPNPSSSKPTEKRRRV